MMALIKRGVRAGLSMLAGMAAAKYGNDPRYMAVMPLLMMGGKYVRDKYPGGLMEWMPF